MANWKIFVIDSFPQLLLSILVYNYDFQLQDFAYLKANPLVWWEIYSIYAVVFFFIFKNVLPKFVGFGGARRHYNDVKDVEKKGMRKFITKNYVRLFLHILSGAIQVLTSGAYVISPKSFNMIFTFEFLQAWFIFWDTVHEWTGWCMTRSHDGIFQIRAFNLAFMVVKLFFCGQIYRMESASDDFVALVGGIFILTSGFAWVRFTCAVTAIAQCIFYNVDMSGLRETWYSWGLWTGQVAIAYRCQVLADMHLVFAFAAFYFPIELWIKTRAKYKYRNQLLCIIGAAFWQYDVNVQAVISTVYLIYGFKYSGIYWKRAPIPGVDYKETKDRESNKRNNLRRSTSAYREVLPAFVSNLISKKQDIVTRVTTCRKNFNEFVNSESASRVNVSPAAKKILTPRGSSARRKIRPTPRMDMSKTLLKKRMGHPNIPQSPWRKKDTPRPSALVKSKKTPLKMILTNQMPESPAPKQPNLVSQDQASHDFDLDMTKMDVAEILRSNPHLSPEQLAGKILSAIGSGQPAAIQKKSTLQLGRNWYKDGSFQGPELAESPGAFFVSRTSLPTLATPRTPSRREHFHY